MAAMSLAEHELATEVAPLRGCARGIQAHQHADPEGLAPTLMVKTLFLVRHGEALHNIEEQKAKKTASAKAEAQGLENGSEAWKVAVEVARKACLKAERLRDAALSDKGKAQASLSKTELEELTSSSSGLPLPARVLVSPMQRTLQTAGLMFPGRSVTQVCEGLRERETCLPCDTPSPPLDMMGCELFSHMDFSDPLASRVAEGPSGEDNSQLRRRIRCFVQEGIATVQENVLCLVTHKAFLRELERGILGYPEASEFGCGEVRVYDVALAADGTIAAVLRHSRACPWVPLAAEEPRPSSPRAGYAGRVPQGPPSPAAREFAIPCEGNTVQVF
jgi:broad specificity phosphatase PhoE